MTDPNQPPPEPMTEAEVAARKSRNRIIALALVGFMGLVFLITLVRLKEGVARDQDWEAETARQDDNSGIVAGEGAPPSTEENDE